MPDLEARAGAARLRPRRKRPDGTERENRHHRVTRALTGDPVSVPGDTGAAVTVKAEPGTDELPAELLREELALPLGGNARERSFT